MLKKLVGCLLAVALACVGETQHSFAGPLDEKLRTEFGAGNLPGLHGTIIELGGNRLAEAYFRGDDERWGEPLVSRDHGPNTLHDLRSVTKSIVGLLYGIALSEGKVPAPDQPLYAQFPKYPDLLKDERRRLILVSHALSMQMGLEWNEDLPYSDPRNSEVAMELAPDRYRYVLEQPVREPPGKTWIYSGGAVALLGKLIEDGTGKRLDAFAKERLFDPLGISRFDWVAGADGVPSAASGLRLTLPDLVKIGRMIANDGLFDGKQVVPAEWLARSFRARVTLDRFTRYGFLWYLSGSKDNIVVVAVGNGGQRLTVQPKYDLVVASFAGRYNDPQSWQTSLKIVLDIAVPGAKQLLEK